MMAPHHIRAMQFEAAIEAAHNELGDALIDAIVIEGAIARVTAGRRVVLVRCRLQTNYDDHGRALLGSDYWTTEIISDAREDLNWLRRLVSLIRT